jgi:hypothetical protein
VPDNDSDHVIRTGDRIRFVLFCDCLRSVQGVHVGVGIDDIMGRRVCSLIRRLDTAKGYLPPSGGQFAVIWDIEECNLAPGVYSISLSIGQSHVGLLDALDNVAYIDVHPPKTVSAWTDSPRAKGVLWLENRISLTSRNE